MENEETNEEEIEIEVGEENEEPEEESGLALDSIGLDSLGGGEEVDEVSDENQTEEPTEPTAEEPTQEYVSLETPLIKLEMGSVTYDVNILGGLMLDLIHKLPSKAFNGNFKKKVGYV